MYVRMALELNCALLRGELFARREVGRDILADRSVRAAARLDSCHTIFR